MSRLTLKKQSGGYGCTCPSFRRSPGPLFVIKALARCAGWKQQPVTVGNRKENPDGFIEWSATSDGVTNYIVTYSPDAPGGFCKHTVGAQQESAWIYAACIGAKEVLTQLEDVTRKLKDVTKERDKWKKSSLT